MEPLANADNVQQPESTVIHPLAASSIHSNGNGKSTSNGSTGGERAVDSAATGDYTPENTAAVDSNGNGKSTSNGPTGRELTADPAATGDYTPENIAAVNSNRNGKASTNGASRGTDSLRAASTEGAELASPLEGDDLAATGDYRPQDPALAKTGVWHVAEGQVYEGSGIDFSLEELPGLAATGEYKPEEIDIHVEKKGHSFTLTDRKILDSFDQIGYVAHGSFGVVLRGMDKLGREVAIKILTSGDKEVQERFYNESIITAQLGAAEPSDRIIKVYERGELEIRDEEGVTRRAPYASMEFIDETVGQRIQQLHQHRTAGDRAAFTADLEKVVRVHFGNACMGIHFAHSKGILHRDIKPSNIGTSTAELGERTRILDWGLGKEKGHTDTAGGETKSTTGNGASSGIALSGVSKLMALYTAAGTVVGTPNYMPPEQALGSPAVDERTDVYSLGATLYEILTGEYPYKGMNGVKLVMGLRDNSITPTPIQELNPDAPRPLRLIAEKAMQPDPEKRYQTAAELAADIERYYTDHQVKASAALPLMEQVREAAALFVSRNRHSVLVSTILAGSLIPASVFGISQYRENERAGDRAAAVSNTLGSIDDMPPQDAESAVRQLERILLTTEGEKHPLVLEQIGLVNKELEERREFIKFRDAERAKYSHFITEADSVIGNMTFNDKGTDAASDESLLKINKLLTTYNIASNPDWADTFSAVLFTEAEVTKAKETAVNLNLAAALRILPFAQSSAVLRAKDLTPAASKEMASAANVYLDAAEKELAGRQSYSLTWLRSYQEACFKELPVPAEPESLKPETEVDYFVKATHRAIGRFHGIDHKASLATVRDGLEQHPNSALLRFSESYFLRVNNHNELALEALVRAEHLQGRESLASLLHKSFILQELCRGNQRPEVALELVDELIQAQKKLIEFEGQAPSASTLKIIAGQKVSVAPVLYERFSDVEGVEERVRAFCDESFTAFCAEQQKGADFINVFAWAGSAVSYARAGRFEYAREMIDHVRTVLPQNISGYGDHEYDVLLRTVGDLAFKARAHEMEAWLYPVHHELLQQRFATMDAPALQQAVVKPEYYVMEYKFHGPSKPEYATAYGRIVAERAEKLGIERDQMSVIPYTGEVPFTSVHFPTAKGTSIFYKGAINWREKVANGEIYNFTQVYADDTYVVLHDRERDMRIRLSKQACERYLEAEQGWGTLYNAGQTK